METLNQGLKLFCSIKKTIKIFIEKNRDQSDQKIFYMKLTDRKYEKKLIEKFTDKFWIKIFDWSIDQTDQTIKILKEI